MRRSMMDEANDLKRQIEAHVNAEVDKLDQLQHRVQKCFELGENVLNRMMKMENATVLDSVDALAGCVQTRVRFDETSAEVKSADRSCKFLQAIPHTQRLENIVGETQVRWLGKPDDADDASEAQETATVEIQTESEVTEKVTTEMQTDPEDDAIEAETRATTERAERERAEPKAAKEESDSNNNSKPLLVKRPVATPRRCRELNISRRQERELDILRRYTGTKYVFLMTGRRATRSRSPRQQSAGGSDARPQTAAGRIDLSLPSPPPFRGKSHTAR